MLLLIRSLRNIVGSVVLPILGAVPDGAIVLFSGLGENAQEEVAIGVGALAGSTIMLLTIPWFLAVYAGRVNLRIDGEPMYSHKPRLYGPNRNSFTLTGVAPKGMVKEAGRYMAITSISYVVIQAMALKTGNFFSSQHTKESTIKSAAQEHNAALFVFVVCMGFFAYYLYSQFNVTPEKKEFRGTVVERITVQAIEEKSISLSAAFTDVVKHSLITAEGENELSPLIASEVNESKKILDHVLKLFFNEYDRDNSEHIDKAELAHLMADLGERLSDEDLITLFELIDGDKNGDVSFEEFVGAIPKFIRHRHGASASSLFEPLKDLEESRPLDGPHGTHEDSDEEEVPHDLRHKDPQTERRRILMRSFRMMIGGTILVLIYADPTVAVMQDLAGRIGISAFYISFALAPLASNASEVVAAYSYGSKKTKKTVTVSFSTLLGAAILNNTLVLAVFMLLIVVKGLAWQFTAETITILFVELVVFYFSQKPVQTLRDGCLVLSLYPISLFLVAFLENVVGLD